MTASVRADGGESIDGKVWEEQNRISADSFLMVSINAVAKGTNFMLHGSMILRWNISSPGLLYFITSTCLLLRFCVKYVEEHMGCVLLS